MKTENRAVQSEPRHRKLAYQKPQLERLGSWSELTRQLPGTGFGGGPGGG